MGKKTSVSCETITTISYISRMLTNRMISINSGSCFATQQLRLWHTSISCSWPTAYLFWVYGTKIENGGHFFSRTNFCTFLVSFPCDTSFLLPLRTTWYDTRFLASKPCAISHAFWFTSKLCDFTDTNELESLDRMHKSVTTDKFLFLGNFELLNVSACLLFPNSDVNYFLKLKLNWNLDRTHKSVITD